MNNFSAFIPSSLFSHAENYTRYLDSRAWQSKKRQYLLSKRPQYCWACGKKPWGFDTKGFNFHHLSYDNLFEEKMTDLMLLCSQHHEELENEWQEIKKQGRGQMTLKLHSFMYVCNYRISHNLRIDPLMKHFEGLIG